MRAPSVGVVGVATAPPAEAPRYAHLLQPIRDLAANWDVDLASELEEYLVCVDGESRAKRMPREATPPFACRRFFSPRHRPAPRPLSQTFLSHPQEALEHVTFSFGGGGPQLNFAEGKRKGEEGKASFLGRRKNPGRRR